MNAKKDHMSIQTKASPLSREASAITIRHLSTSEEYLECVELQKETWGRDFVEVVPSSLLKISQKIGGVTSGAFDESGRLLGFVYGLTGLKKGKLVHWSHMLAVRRDARGLGLGRRLKLFQREQLLAEGVTVVYWTFDPLVARNAQLNINSLGALVTEYVKDMYIDSSSELHRGLGMDRFIVTWQLDNQRVMRAISNSLQDDVTRYRSAPVVNTKAQNDQSIVPVDFELPLTSSVRVEIPSDIESIQTNSLQLGGQWRLNTRRVFLWYFERAYQIAAFYIDAKSGRSFYCLDHQT